MQLILETETPSAHLKDNMSALDQETLAEKPITNGIISETEVIRKKSGNGTNDSDIVNSNGSVEELHIVNSEINGEVTAEGVIDPTTPAEESKQEIQAFEKEPVTTADETKNLAPPKEFLSPIEDKEKELAAEAVVDTISSDKSLKKNVPPCDELKVADPTSDEINKAEVPSNELQEAVPSIDDVDKEISSFEDVNEMATFNGKINEVITEEPVKLSPPSNTDKEISPVSDAEKPVSLDDNVVVPTVDKEAALSPYHEVNEPNVDMDVSHDETNGDDGIVISADESPKTIPPTGDLNEADTPACESQKSASSSGDLKDVSPCDETKVSSDGGEAIMSPIADADAIVSSSIEKEEFVSAVERINEAAIDMKETTTSPEEELEENCIARELNENVLSKELLDKSEVTQMEEDVLENNEVSTTNEEPKDTEMDIDEEHENKLLEEVAKETEKCEAMDVDEKDEYALLNEGSGENLENEVNESISTLVGDIVKGLDDEFGTANLDDDLDCEKVTKETIPSQVNEHIKPDEGSNESKTDCEKETSKEVEELIPNVATSEITKDNNHIYTFEQNNENGAEKTDIPSTQSGSNDDKPNETAVEKAKDNAEVEKEKASLSDVSMEADIDLTETYNQREKDADVITIKSSESEKVVDDSEDISAAIDSIINDKDKVQTDNDKSKALVENADDVVEIVEDAKSDFVQTEVKESNKENNTPLIKLSNNMDILSDEEDNCKTETQKPINLDDDDDIMLIDDDNIDEKDDKAPEKVAEKEESEPIPEDSIVDLDSVKEPEASNVVDSDTAKDSEVSGVVDLDNEKESDPSGVVDLDTVKESEPSGIVDVDTVKEPQASGVPSLDTEKEPEASEEPPKPADKETSLVEVSDEMSKQSDSSVETAKIPEKVEKPRPLIPEDFFKTYRKNLTDMTRDDLEEFCILKIVESIIDRSNLNEIRAKLKSMAQNIDDYKKKALLLSKQNRDLQVVLKSVQEEQKKRSDQPIAPLKITRSVGMQVLMSDKSRRRNLPIPTPSNATVVNAPINSNNTRTTRNVTRTVKPVTPQQIPVPRLVPATNNVQNRTNVVPQASNATKTYTNLNGVKVSSLPTLKAPEKRTHSRMQTQSQSPNQSVSSPSSVTVDLTDDEPPSKVPTKSPAPPVRLVYQPNHMSPRQPFNQPTGSPRKVFIPINSQGPVRGGQAIMLKTVSGGSVRPKGPAPPMVRLPPNSMAMRKVQSGRHPAPLPEMTKQCQPPNWKSLPPAPDLKLSKVENGIVISWKIDGYQEDSYEEIASYQLYAYQETSAPPSTSLWKKIGDVKALPLPMACTLTQFMAGYKYYFAVRAVDIRSRYGPFSLPGSILLLNKM